VRYVALTRQRRGGRGGGNRRRGAGPPAAAGPESATGRGGGKLLSLPGLGQESGAVEAAAGGIVSHKCQASRDAIGDEPPFEPRRRGEARQSPVEAAHRHQVGRIDRRHRHAHAHFARRRLRRGRGCGARPRRRRVLRRHRDGDGSAPLQGTAPGTAPVAGARDGAGGRRGHRAWRRAAGIGAGTAAGAVARPGSATVRRARRVRWRRAGHSPASPVA
jgi:hypothetical protein